MDSTPDEMLENDEITPEEAGFMIGEEAAGYEGEEDDEEEAERKREEE